MMKMTLVKNGFWLLLLAVLCGQCRDRQEEGELIYQNYCGSCHLAPAPAGLSKYMWGAKVLPEMGARLGVQTEGYDPLSNMPAADRQLISRQNFYPQEPLISPEEWNKLYEFVVAQAPAKLPQNPPLQLTEELPLFDVHPVSLDERKGALTTFISSQDSLQQFLVGNGFGELLAWREGAEARILQKTNTPVVSHQYAGDQAFLLEAGDIRPTERRSGKFYVVEDGKKQLILDELHRPVYTLIDDLNEDQRDEILLCEFGYYTGQLSLLAASESGGYERTNVLPVPGIMRVIAEDMDRDGRKDLVLMASQGDEGVDILYQEDSLQFRRERVLRFDPLYGSSWFELIDYDGDGDKDLITVNGDNADYSITLKPYHGLRIFINNGNNQFFEQMFYPLHGATRVVARDFDQDGDIDLAVTCFFPDFEKQPEASFVYLENLTPEQYTFKARTFPGSADGRWLIMEAEDYDADGDEDLILGSFTFPMTPVPQKLLSRWESSNIDVFLLENQSR